MKSTSNIQSLKSQASCDVTSAQRFSTKDNLDVLKAHSGLRRHRLFDF